MSTSLRSSRSPSLIRRTLRTGFIHMFAFRSVRMSSTALLATASLVGLSACGGAPADSAPAADTTPVRVAGTVLRLTDSTLTALIEASGVAEPMQQATVSTKLMGTVTAVRVREGDVVREGQVLLQIDARELNAKSSQVAASIADAEAMQADAATQAARIRALYADSAATRAQYDAAQTGLARAEAGVRAARAAANEVAAMGSYATVRAPFNGMVTARFADPGTFAAPGAPLLTVQDASTLRISVSASGEAVRAHCVVVRRSRPGSTASR
ncbi:MAG: efflux RND transporter periplasmic adaptor subunit [Gemmatimonadaceae bacterium]|nr:efflux RND transporter periplasmic adaptor subunit [Gemmatimonadaceae bacterium]